jgi:Ca2+/Na+ antiporter
LLTLLILISITKAAIVDAKKFHMKYLITRTVKLILLVAFCLVYVMCNGENNISFISSVVVCYLCYTVYEAFILKKFNDMLSKENSEVE